MSESTDDLFSLEADQQRDYGAWHGIGGLTSPPCSGVSQVGKTLYSTSFEINMKGCLLPIHPQGWRVHVCAAHRRTNDLGALDTEGNTEAGQGLVKDLSVRCAYSFCTSPLYPTPSDQPTSRRSLPQTTNSGPRVAQQQYRWRARY
jgi:hypothetical protein